MIKKQALIDSNKDLANALKIMHGEYFMMYLNYKGMAKPYMTREELAKEFGSLEAVQISDSVLKRHGLLLEGAVRWGGNRAGAIR